MAIKEGFIGQVLHANTVAQMFKMSGLQENMSIKNLSDTESVQLRIDEAPTGDDMAILGPSEVLNFVRGDKDEFLYYQTASGLADINIVFNS